MLYCFTQVPNLVKAAFDAVLGLLGSRFHCNIVT